MDCGMSGEWDIFSGAATPDFGQLQRERDSAIFGDKPSYSDRRSVPPRHAASLAERAAMEAAANEKRQAAYLQSIAGPPAVFDEPEPVEEPPAEPAKPTRAETRQELVERANALLASLTPRQRKEAIERAKAAMAADPRDERGRFRSKPQPKILRDDELTAPGPLVRP
jgi:hypothetical protein